MPKHVLAVTIILVRFVHEPVNELYYLTKQDLARNQLQDGRIYWGGGSMELSSDSKTSIDYFLVLNSCSNSLVSLR